MTIDTSLHLDTLEEREHAPAADEFEEEDGDRFDEAALLSKWMGAEVKEVQDVQDV